MKNTRLHIMAALACAVLALAGCTKFEWTSGTAIRFNAGTQAEALTRTSYGEIVSGSPKKQMVDWSKDDVIRIVCAQASTTEPGTKDYADYMTTTAGERYGTTAESRARLTLYDSSAPGLKWGSTAVAHKFFAVYPSPAVKAGTALTAEGAFTGVIPSSQAVTSISGASPAFSAEPDMTNQYMLAGRTVAAGDQDISGDEVFLNFTPFTTSIEFEVTNSMSDALTIGSIEISSAEKNLSGTFTNPDLESGLNENGLYPEDSYPAFTASTGAGKTASVNFGSTGHTLAVGDKLTFTVFLLPESDLADLTFKINKSGGGYIKTSLKNENSTTHAIEWIAFGRCKRHFIRGLFVNEGAIWKLASDPGVDSWDGTNPDIEATLDDPALGLLPSLICWDKGEDADIDLRESEGFVFSFADGTGSTSHTFTGIPSSSGTSKTIDVTSTVGGDVQDWIIKSVGGVSVNGTEYTTPDGGLKVENVSGNLKITDLRQKTDYGDKAHWTTEGTEWYRAPLSGTIDLSRRDFRTGGSTGTTTANCYIVRNPGTYTIPLVYGNAVRNSNDNRDAYAPGSGSGTKLGTFVNHLGNGIFDPFIENNTVSGVRKVAKDATTYLKAEDAVVLWSDAPGVITVDGYGIEGTAKTVSTTGNNRGLYTDGEYNHGDVRQIKFTVSEDNIRQCNALIAVRDASNNIMWSWHIWITNDPSLGSSSVPDPSISVTNLTNKTSAFFPVPCIGYIEPAFYKGNEGNPVTIILEQVGNEGETIDVAVTQNAHYDAPTGTYYQFGRKDPMPRTDDTTPSFSTGHIMPQAASLEDSILHPDWFYAPEEAFWCSTRYDNLWTGKHCSTTPADENDDMVKTIYDPSPAGYKVPSINVFTGFTTTGIQSTSLSECNVEGDYVRGWHFYRQPGRTGGTVFFPKIQYRNSDGTLTTNSSAGRYRSSTPDPYAHSYEMNFTSGYVNPAADKGGRRLALPIRPIVGQ